MMPLAHLPTLLLLIGYPLYWLELYAWPHPTGHTTWLATGIFVAAAVVLFFRNKVTVPVPDLPKWFWVTAAGLIGLMVGVAFAASLLPPHLSQEFDVINYHVALPRQHLLTGSFAHLTWSSADLFLLPVDLALAPYWLATELPNKWPQFLFMLGAGVMIARLAFRLSGGRSAAACLALTALFGLHSFGIQAGTAMLDIALCYLFFAAVDSFLSGHGWLAAAEFTFFFWAKPLSPILMAIVIALTVLVMLVCRCRADFSGRGLYPWKKGVLGFVLFSIFIAGPFMVKSVLVAGTPLYPVTAAVVTRDACLPEHRGQLSATDQRSCQFKESYDIYGHGRSLAAFMKHFWLIAVPENSVNNAFDYPLGLSYLLFLFPFLMIFWRGLLTRKMPVLAVFVVIYWGLWFLGSQQSRFLLIPLAGMFVVVAVELARPSRIFLGCLLLALAMTAVSVVRAHAPDLGRSAYDILRPQDKALLARAKTVQPGEIVRVDFVDVAFAPYIVDVRDDHNVFSIKR